MTWTNRPGPDDRPMGWWAKTVLAGLLGGVAMALFLMAAYSGMGRGAWFPINGMATVLPMFQPVPGALPSPDFVPGPSLTGLAIHLIVSMALGVVFGALVEGFMPKQARSVLWASLAGLIFAHFVWMFLGFGGIYLAGLQSVFGTATFFLAHLAFGIVCGVSLALLTSKRDLEPEAVTVTFAPEAREARKPVERR